MKYNRRIEFSKIMVTGVVLMTVIIAVFTLVIVWKTSDSTPLAYLIPSVFAEGATGLGFYYSKAKVENKIKLMKLYGVPISEQTFHDNL